MAHVLFSMGMLRSGSTWAFNVTRQFGKLIADRTKVPFEASYLMGQATDELLDANPPGVRVVKAHLVGPKTLEMLRAGRVRSVTTYRDPRDCVASLMTFLGESFEESVFRTTCNLAFMDEYRHSPAALFVRYEAMMADPMPHVRRIGQYVGVNASDRLIAQIHAATNLDAAGRTCSALRSQATDGRHVIDGVTQLHDNHISRPTPGRFETDLSEDQIEHVNEAFGPWLAKLGYPVVRPAVRQTSVPAGV